MRQPSGTRARNFARTVLERLESLACSGDETAIELIDTMPDNQRMDEIRAAAAKVPGVRGVEKCFARKTGLRYHVDLHLEVDPEMTVRRSHDIAHNVQLRIKETLEWVADVLVHVEPAP